MQALAYAALIGMAAFALTGFLAGRIWERRDLIQDWRDQDKAWQEYAQFVAEVEKMRAELVAEVEKARAELLGQHLVELPEPQPVPAYPTDAVPCLFHGSHHAADPPCNPPEDTDWLANSGILFAIDQAAQLSDFAKWLDSWSPPKLPAPRRGSQAGLTGRKG